MGVEPTQVADLLALHGRCRRQHSRRAGHRRKGRARICSSGSVRWRRCSSAPAEVERKMYRESLQNNVERIRMSKRLATIADRRADRVFAGRGEGAGRAMSTLLKSIYKDMEFHSLLKELGPREDTRARDYACIAGPEELQAWLARATGVPVAVAISKAAEGEFALDTIGLAWRPGEARAVAGENLARLKPWLEDAGAPKIACDVKSALLELGRMGIDARGFDHDVMLYAFLLDADPSRLRAGGTGAAQDSI